jgi:glutamine synthetase
MAAKERKGWLEDRRPNANMDPYTVTRLIVETCCSALAAADALPSTIAETAEMLAAAR